MEIATLNKWMFGIYSSARLFRFISAKRSFSERSSLCLEKNSTGLKEIFAFIHASAHLYTYTSVKERPGFPSDER